MTSRPTFAELFTPKLVTVFREGYRLDHLRADAIAGLTVAIVALPLSMAIAVASGASPAQGLYTAIIGGFLVSALGGSRFQIGGPAGAGKPRAIPESLYLTAKPGFFGDNPWPWVDPASGKVHVLPAKACIEQGKMPTCMMKAR